MIETYAVSEEDERLFAEARAVRREVGRDETLRRALIEVSNVCRCNCLYCGIRRDRRDVRRYRLSEGEVLECVEAARRQGYTAIALQAGELADEENTRFYEGILRKLGDESLEVTLSLGEQSEETYRRWKSAAGGRVLRYLLRIESSNPQLFAKIHPAENSYVRRLECIRTLKRLGYVTGSGVMIGLPGQTLGDLADDLEFFRRERLDMVGMGPYIPTPGTPLAELPVTLADPFLLTLRMIARTRLLLRDVNIVASTALEAMHPRGRELGLAAGANVIMPKFTPAPVSAEYALYPFGRDH